MDKVITEDIEGVYSQRINDIYKIYISFKGKRFSKMKVLHDFFNDSLEKGIQFIFEKEENVDKLFNGFNNLINFIKDGDNDRLMNLLDILERFRNHIQRVVDDYEKLREYHIENPNEWKNIIKNRDPKLDESLKTLRELLKEMNYYNKIMNIQEKLFGKKMNKWTRFFSENTIRKYLKNTNKNILSESLNKDDYQKIKKDPELKQWLELMNWNESDLTDEQKRKIKVAEKYIEMWGDSKDHADNLRDKVMEIVDSIFTPNKDI